MNIKKRIPFLYVEFTKIKVKDNTIHLCSQNEEKSINVGNYTCIVIGKGSSITSDATKIIGKNRTLLIFSGYKMSSITLHSPSNYKGKLRQSQYKKTSNKRSKLKMAKILMKIKNKEIPQYLPKANYKAKDIQSLLTQEAVWTKQAYTKIARHHGQVWLGREYALQNKHKMFLVNKLLYSMAYMAILSLGLDPNLGIIHNGSSGMGLALDIADIFKPSISWDNTFKEYYDENFIFGQINEKMVMKKMIHILEILYN